MKYLSIIAISIISFTILFSQSQGNNEFIEDSNALELELLGLPEIAEGNESELNSFENTANEDIIINFVSFDSSGIQQSVLGLDWGISPDETRGILTKQGFEKRIDNSYAYVLFGDTVLITSEYLESKLRLVCINFTGIQAAERDSLIMLFADIQEILIEAFGNPKKIIENIYYSEELSSDVKDLSLLKFNQWQSAAINIELKLINPINPELKLNLENTSFKASEKVSNKDKIKRFLNK